jgi:NAD(P)-dependent dehydrogenase (short-subunit alcohol dehydrogenase family)
LERFGSLAGAVICHGVIGAPPSVIGYGPGNALTSYEQMKFVTGINFLGVYNVAQKVAEILIKQEPLAEDGERGAIILISSIAGLDGSLVSYGTTKCEYSCVREKSGGQVQTLTLANYSCCCWNDSSIRS